MRSKGLIVEITDKGYIVELEDGNLGLLPISKINEYKYADTLIDKKVEVSILIDKGEILVLDNSFKFSS